MEGQNKMPRILEQYEVHCGVCGEYLWKYFNSGYVVGLGETEKDRDDVCQKCDPRTFFSMVKSAEKITPLTQNQRDDAKA
jgi:hypothetical protein